MSEEQKIKMSRQINLKLYPSCHRELTELSKLASIRYNERITTQAVIREAIKISFDELERKCK